MAGGELVFETSGVTPRKLDAYAALLSDVFGRMPKFTREAIAWRYRDNPAGEVVGCDAWAGDSLAAHYVTSPIEATVEGKALRGLLSLNTATHADFRGRRLFQRLAEATYARATDLGYAFVIGVANANSTHGMVKTLGFQPLGPLRAGLIGRLPRAYGGSELQYEGRWTDEMLRWRLANPAARYTVARSGALTGVWARTHVPAVHCVGFLAGAERSVETGRAPFAASLFIGLEPRLQLSGLGFAPIPMRLRPSPLNLTWKSLSKDAPPALDRRTVALNFLDFDPY